jgi:magnesium chelatase subunit I
MPHYTRLARLELELFTLQSVLQLFTKPSLLKQEINMNDHRIYPFSAIVGQEKMKMALILNAINPKLGGVLISGEKGTAKSTAVRALAELLPDMEVVTGCRFFCDPTISGKFCPDCQEKQGKEGRLTTSRMKMKVVDLPINATEDRVIGTLDLEHAIKKGEKRFEPGILAQANRGILYVDEVNLLDDHIVDVLLDSAAMGVNTVEREGISYTHPAEFILVGTMNPEEGELRPQLLDRFGLCVNITGISDPAKRVEIVMNRAHFEEDPVGMAKKWKSKDQELAEKIIQAKAILPQVSISKELLLRIAKISIALNVNGHRSDLIMMKASKTIAGFNGRKEVQAQDINDSLEIALAHRMRRQPFEDMVIEPGRISDLVRQKIGD